MNFNEITRMMLTSMDFFELRRTAARYNVQYQGVRRQKLVRDIERKILSKATPQPQSFATSDVATGATLASSSPEAAVSAKPSLAAKPLNTRINTFSARNVVSRAAAK